MSFFDQDLLGAAKAVTRLYSISFKSSPAILSIAILKCEIKGMGTLEDLSEPVTSSQVEQGGEVMVEELKSAVDPTGQPRAEIGQSHNCNRKQSVLTSLWSLLKGRLQTSVEQGLRDETARERQPAQVEDFRPGYPQFSALIGSHASFHVCRRFLRMRARLLLYKQDELSVLESLIDQIDHEERSDLFLSNRRRDRNAERLRVFKELDLALSSYDVMVDRTRTFLECDDPRMNDIVNLRNWVANTSSLARDETAYLFDTRDLMTVISPRDTAVARVAPMIEKCMRGLYRILKQPRGVSRDENVSVFSVSLLERLTRSLIACFVVTFLLVPIVIINALASLALRLVVIVVACAVLITTLSGFTNAKTVEVFVSGATYATVLVVFISGNGAKGS